MTTTTTRICDQCGAEFVPSKYSSAQKRCSGRRGDVLEAVRCPLC